MHPFDPLSSEEITKVQTELIFYFNALKQGQAAQLVRSDNVDATPNFRAISLAEPMKSDMIVYLDKEHGRQHDVPSIPRRARVMVYVGRAFYEYLIQLDDNKILKKEHLQGRHSNIDPIFMEQVAEACLADSNVQKEIDSLELPPGSTVVVEPWAYATDGMNDMSTRISMCWFYMRISDHLDANFYAYPLDLCAEVSEDFRVLKVYRLPTTAGSQINDTRKPFDRRKVHTSSEYHPDLVPQHRTTTRPLQVHQPEGPSFQVQENLLTWEKWSMRVGFNYREGLTLHDVRYAGRSLFYRLSLSEMFVPYGDSRSPFPRKGAFDLGNDGAGVGANNLKLGCDCLGHIKYFDGWHVTNDGLPLKLPNVVCCHEIDDGILWKHTNYRTGNAVVTRSRVLVLQTVITVTNYEYIFAFHFSQDAGITYEVRATGILSTAPIEIGEQVPFGTIVAPGVMALYHQHLFCLRLDPAIDGHRNSLVVEETHPTPIEDQKPGRIAGVGFSTTSETVMEECGLDLDFNSNRIFKIVNENVTNPTTGTPVAYKLLPHYSQPLLAHVDSFHARRSEYAKHAVWVTRYDDDELYAAGKYTMQSTGGEGIGSWIAGRKKDEAGRVPDIRNDDIVVWHSFGSTHNPRIEDWPVMPCEKMSVGLKPVNFFSANPSLDVAISTQERNCSVLVDGTS